MSSTTTKEYDVYGTKEATEGTVFNVTGQDWDDVVQGAQEADDDHLVVNMGPQHPSTHGVLRLVLTLDGETVDEARVGIGYLHTGIEKNMEYRTWTQGTTFCTRMDYLSPVFNETAYCMAIEKLLGISDQVPERAEVIRVMMMEITRISSHLVATATFGLELGATTVMLNGFLEREYALDIVEMITGVRMNPAYVRPGGVSQDLPPGAIDKIGDFVKRERHRFGQLRKLLDANPVYIARTKDIAYLDLTGCMA
ncbi:MAG: NADH dehydrogenase subunit D, partial [Actinoallomurus sp.]